MVDGVRQFAVDFAQYAVNADLHVEAFCCEEPVLRVHLEISHIKY